MPDDLAQLVVFAMANKLTLGQGKLSEVERTIAQKVNLQGFSGSAVALSLKLLDNLHSSAVPPAEGELKKSRVLALTAPGRRLGQRVAANAWNKARCEPHIMTKHLTDE